jgi:hypothetical protein
MIQVSPNLPALANTKTKTQRINHMVLSPLANNGTFMIHTSESTKRLQQSLILNDRDLRKSVAPIQSVPSDAMNAALQTNYKAFSSGRVSSLKKK